MAGPARKGEVDPNRRRAAGRARGTEQLLGRGPQKIMSGALVFGDAICEIADLFIEAR